jgi:NADH-quinone oxidoreductase subunit A
VVFREWLLKGQGLFALTEILLFLGILMVGLAYVWAKRDLEWIKRLPQETESPERQLPKAA